MRAELIFTIGRMETLKFTFLTRKEYVLITPELALIVSLKNRKAIIPVKRYATKGTSPLGRDLNPTLKTNHIISISNSGSRKAQKRPRNDPMYLCLKSRFVNS
jgi:hypothetical protein